MGLIKFGTDGWRAKMGREFSFRNVRIFTHAYFNYLKKHSRDRELRVIVNYDTRFLSKQFAQEAAKIFSLSGVKTLIPTRDAPLPAISLATVEKKCSGAINFTASFNEPIYNGIKIFNRLGAPSMPRETDLIENEVDRLEGHFSFKPQYSNDQLIDNVDVRGPYIKYLTGLIDFDLIRNSGMVIVVDNLYGSSREYLDYILSNHNIDMESIHNFPYSSFGGVIPSCSPENLQDLSRLVIEKKAHIGLATDIDGDRFGIVNASGKYISANMIVPPLIEYLIAVRKMRGGIVKSLSTTGNIKRVADYYARKVYTTPVGFKYVAQMLLKKKAFIGVESTNGACLNEGITIKDGILFNLLVCEMLAFYRKDLDEIMDDFSMKFSKLFNLEVSVKKNSRRDHNFRELLSNPKPALNGLHPEKIIYDDGIKFIFKDSWMLLRESGTSNLFRIYAESPMLKETKKMIQMGKQIIG
jgi:phosphoglucomutase